MTEPESDADIDPTLDLLNAYFGAPDLGDDVMTPLVTPERGWFGRRAQGVTADVPGFDWYRPLLAGLLVAG